MSLALACLKSPVASVQIQIKFVWKNKFPETSYIQQFHRDCTLIYSKSFLWQWNIPCILGQKSKASKQRDVFTLQYLFRNTFNSYLLKSWTTRHIQEPRHQSTDQLVQQTNVNSIIITIDCYILWMAPALITMVTIGLFCHLPTKKRLCHPGKVTPWEETQKIHTIHQLPFSLLSLYLSPAPAVIKFHTSTAYTWTGIKGNAHVLICRIARTLQEIHGGLKVRGFHLKLNSELTTMGMLEEKKTGYYTQD